MPCRLPYRWLMALLLAICSLIGGPSYAANTTELKAKQIWQLLDYVAVDYGGAVANGVVLKSSEYAEMQEFSATAERQLENYLTRPTRVACCNKRPLCVLR